MHVCLHAWVDLGENGSRGSSGQGSRGQRANDGDKDGASTGDEGKGSGWDRSGSLVNLQPGWMHQET